MTGFSGVLQVDGYAGYGELTRPNRPGGAVTLAFCLAHARRQFFEIYQSSESSVAAEALRRIGVVYEIEERVRGLTAAELRGYPAGRDQTDPRGVQSVVDAAAGTRVSEVESGGSDPIHAWTLGRPNGVPD